MPAGSEIVITYDGDDITSSCLFELCSFESQMAAMPGSFTVVVKDPNQTLEFITGRELTLDVDGTRIYGGYILQVSKQYAFPASDTTVPSSVKGRQWVLQGVDYNIIFDKRVLRNTSGYTSDIPDGADGIFDGEVIRTLFDNYFDIPAGFDFSDTGRILDSHEFTSGYSWDTQGVKMREVLEDLAQYGSIYYIDADKQLHFIPVQETAAGWGLSDNPNDAAFGSGPPTPNRGFREGEMIEDATAIANDALVWGGSAWADDGDIVFARRENATSISAHGRWQLAENRVGDANYKIQAEVDARAKVIVDGNESGTFAEGSKGLVNPAKQFRGAWFAHQVPTDAGVRQHLIPGQVVEIEMDVFNFTMNVPLRSVRITFPELDPTEDPSLAWVRFDGFFGVLMSDPYWLWAYLRSLQGRGVVSKSTSAFVVATASNSSVSPPYGSQYSDVPSPDPDGATTVFTIPFPYIATTLQVYINGALKSRGTHYTESDPTVGQFTMVTAPGSSDEMWVIAVLS